MQSVDIVNQTCKGKTSALKKLGLIFIICGITLVLLELALRVIFALKVGPDVLLFGTQYCCGNQAAFDKKGTHEKLNFKFHTVRFHQNKKQNYSKYYPNQNRMDIDEFGETFAVTINQQGFRGKDFASQKEDGVFRVITLGASSTFGYHDRDHETYPFYLEEQLNSYLKDPQCAGIKKVEVINFGVPHLRTENILALFKEEGKPLKPDVVTFYEGVNNSAENHEMLREKRSQDRTLGNQLIRLVEKFRYHLYQRLITVALINNLITFHSETFSEEDFSVQLDGKVHKFIGDIISLNEEVAATGAVLILANQQAKSEFVKRENMRGLTYRQEVDFVTSRLQRSNAITLHEILFLVHSELMKALEPEARANDIRFVDVITALDARRDLLLSWVHLAPDGNKVVADALAKEIQNVMCQGPGPTKK